MRAREGGAVGDEVGRCALAHDPAAVAAGPGPEVDDPVGVRASPAPKNSSASVTDIASTWLMSPPSRSWSTTDASKRFPAHSSQGDATAAIIARSV